jgi:hypothetical protein
MRSTRAAQTLVKRKPPNFWSDKHNQREFLDQLAIKLGLHSISDYLSVPASGIKKHGGTPLLNKYPSFLQILQELYPDHHWNIWERKLLPRNFWRSQHSHKLFLDHVQSKLQINSLTDWKSVNHEKIIALKGKPLLEHYSSLQNALRTLYPNQDWDIVFNTTSTQPSHEKLLQRLAKKLGCQTLDELQNISEPDFLAAGGREILHQHTSIGSALLTLYPDPVTRKTPLLRKLPNGYWNIPENRVRYLKLLESKLNIQKPEDWAHVKGVNLRNIFGSASYLNHFGGMQQMIQYYYPGIHSMTRREITRPKHFWNDAANIREFLDSVKDQLNIRSAQDWTRIGRRQISLLGGHGALTKFGSIYSLLRIAYPELLLPAREAFQQHTKRSSQSQLFLQLTVLFPHCEIVEEFLYDDHRYNGTALQFDVFLPDYNLAFEYFGEHHYHDIPAFGSLDMYQLRDEEKRTICQRLGLCLVIVPYWWDMTLSSLRGFISAVDPKLLLQYAVPIRIVK